MAHSAQLAGAERSLLRLLGGLDRRRFEPTVLLPEHGPFEDRARAMGVKTIRARYSWWVANRNGVLAFLARFWWTIVNLPALLLAAHAARPDIVYTNTLVIPQGALLARLLGVPHVWHVREMLPNSTLNTPLPRRLLLSLVARLSSSVVVVSESSATLFADQHGARVHVIHNGVELREPEDRDPDRIARIATGLVRLVVVGTLSPAKRTLDAVRAVEILRTAFPRVRLAVVGAGLGSYERSVRRYVDSHGLTDHVSFLGYRDDVIDILADADLMLMPAWPEAFGLVTVEALSVGTPVVGANTTGTSEILRAGGGLLVEPGRPELIADAVRELVSTPERYLQARREAYAAARAFSVGREIASVEDEITRAFGEPA